MFDFLPWMDEVHIVELGRLFLCGGDPSSIVLNQDGVQALPVAYICPLLQECAFRLFGQIGVRISPFVGLVFLWFSFRKWLLSSYAWKRPLTELVALLLPTCPLVFQSAALARPDSWALAFTFAALAVLGRPGTNRSVLRLSLGAFLAVLSVFAWPSSLVSALVYPVFCFDSKRRRAFGIFCLAAILSATILALPLIPKAELYYVAFQHHAKDTVSTSYTLRGLCEPFARELARSPLLAVIGSVGVVVWIVRRRYMALVAAVFGFALCVKTGLYALRLLYMTPVFMLLCADAVDFLVLRHPRLTRWFVLITVVYGFVSGPVGNLCLKHATLPAGLKENLSKTVGVGPKAVLAPDFATYYIGRELGWRQLGFGNFGCAGDAAFVGKIAERSEAVVLCDWDPYEVTQRSWTPYGLVCRYFLEKAREESDRPEADKSWPARFGSQFRGGWQTHVSPDGFSVTNRFGQIRVLTRK